MLKQVLLKQYNKCFGMLLDTIEKCDEGIWFDDQNYHHPAWHVLYHVLFYANIYCSATEAGIEPWPKGKVDYEVLGKTPWPPHEEVIVEETFAKSEIVEFLDFVKGKVPAYLDEMSPEEDCWPFWYDETQLEFHINNIRHIQHHTAEIIERNDIADRFQYSWK